MFPSKTVHTMRYDKIIFPMSLILLQDILYGLGDPISKYAYESIPVYSLLTIRYWTALAFLVLFFGKPVFRELKVCSWKALILPSLCMALTFIISNFAMKLTSATAVAFLRSTSTVITPLLALLVYRKRYSVKHIPILILVLVGLYLLCGSGGLSGFGGGELLALMSALLMSGALLFAGETVHSISPVTITTVQTAFSAVLATGCTLVFDGGLQMSAITPKIGAIIVYLAILCTVAGYLLQNYALKSMPASTVALLQCAYPVMTAMFSFVILRERLTITSTLGMVMILACVAAETCNGNA